MRVLVLVKHVPDTTEVRFGDDGALLVRQAPTKVNDYDRNALELAAQLREHEGATVVLAGVGPGEATKTFKEALAFGGESAILAVADEPVDSAGVATVITAICQSEGPFDLVLAGDVSEDGYDGLVPGLVAARLGWPIIRGATALNVESASVSVTRSADDAEETFRVGLPAVVSVTRLINTPRTITTMQVMKVPMSRVRAVSLAELGVAEREWVEETRAVRLISVRPATSPRANEVLVGEPADVVATLVDRMEKLGVLS